MYCIKKKMKQLTQQRHTQKKTEKKTIQRSEEKRPRKDETTKRTRKAWLVHVHVCVSSAWKDEEAVHRVMEEIPFFAFPCLLITFPYCKAVVSTCLMFPNCCFGACAGLGRWGSSGLRNDLPPQWRCPDLVL